MMKKTFIEFIAAVLCLCVLSGGVIAYKYLLEPKLTPPATQEEPEPLPEDILVMSYNIKCWVPDAQGNRIWSVRKPIMFKQIRDINPDLIGMQEVTKAQAPSIEDEFSKDYGVIGEYRDATLWSEKCSILYKLERFELISYNTFWLSETPDVRSRDWNAGCYRVCTYAVLRDKNTNKKLVFCNTHLDNSSAEAREKGAALIIDKMKALEYPSFLVGDMNATNTSNCYKIFTEELDDAQKVATETMTGNTYHSFVGKINNSSPIDYCFLTKNHFDVHKYTILNSLDDSILPSDHYALTISLKLKDAE